MSNPRLTKLSNALRSGRGMFFSACFQTSESPHRDSRRLLVNFLKNLVCALRIHVEGSNTMNTSRNNNLNGALNVTQRTHLKGKPFWCAKALPLILFAGGDSKTNFLSILRNRQGLVAHHLPHSGCALA
jgi:hypothetical protein